MTEFNLADILVDDTTETVEITDKRGNVLKLEVKPLTWTDESDAASKAFVIRQGTGDDGKAAAELVYNPTQFRIEVLKKRIVKAPFPVTDQVLRNLDPDVGAQLAKLVPDPFEGMLKAAGAPKD